MAAETHLYNLVHITTGGEYKAPLVASQLFDQAECQATNVGTDAPGKVAAWVIGAMREYRDPVAQEKIRSLQERCPHIQIVMTNGISRLQQFPVMQLMSMQRRKLGKKTPVIYHCRGEEAAMWALKLKERFPQDKVVLDVRGHWPSEKLYMKGIEYPEKATGNDLAEYESLRNRLKKTASAVDGVSTVSNALRELLIAEAGAPADTIVVPCCVTHITDNGKRDEYRNDWGVRPEERLVVYSGTTAAYQHLEDLTIPFMKELAEADKNVRLAFFSSEIDKIRGMLKVAGVDVERVILKSFPQKEVAGALTACDAGILIRKPTLVNRVANPVKIAEYLAAGLPIIIEKGVGGVDEALFGQGLLQGIALTQPGSDLQETAKDAAKWLSDGNEQRKVAVQTYASEVYLWKSAIKVNRKLYLKLIGK